MKRLTLLAVLVFLLGAGVLNGQTAIMPRIGTEAELNGLSVTKRGLPVIVTNASSATDCTFSSGTGDNVHFCYWCDLTTSWVVAGACTAGAWTDSAATEWTDSAATDWTDG